MTNTSEVVVSMDKSKLDIAFVHAFLTRSYWAEGRTMEEVKITIANSICFGIYLKDEQIGFARVMTDGIVFCYLMDVFIIEKYRGKGYSKSLLNYIFAQPQLRDIPKWLLGTKDAHDLYKQFGFTELSNPERMMQWIKNKK